VASGEALDSNYRAAAGGNVYAVSTMLGALPNAKGETPGVTCITCIVGEGSFAHT